MSFDRPSSPHLPSHEGSFYDYPPHFSEDQSNVLPAFYAVRVTPTFPYAVLIFFLI